MPRVSLGMALLFGSLVSVEAFIGGMFVQREVFGNPPAERTLSAAASLPEPIKISRVKDSERELAELQGELELLRAQIKDRFVREREVTITESQIAYPLVEPKLMISVNALHGGPILAHFGTESHSFMVGQRVDFRVSDCFCFLLLRESARGKAVFHFGCERTDPDEAPLQADQQSAPSGNDLTGQVAPVGASTTRSDTAEIRVISTSHLANSEI